MLCSCRPSSADLVRQVVNLGGYSALAIASPDWASQFSSLGAREASLPSLDNSGYVVASKVSRRAAAGSPCVG